MFNHANTCSYWVVFLAWICHCFLVYSLSHKEYLGCIDYFAAENILIEQGLSNYNPMGQIQPTTYFYMSHELRIIFTFFNS